MYVKIQKDLTDNYLIVEGKNVEFSTEKFPVDFKDYFEKYVPCYLKYNERANCSDNLSNIQLYLFYNYDWSNTHPVTVYEEHSKMPEVEALNNQILVNNEIEAAEKKLMISGVIVDGVRYFTCGRIYIMNDSGKTIQSI